MKCKKCEIELYDRDIVEEEKEHIMDEDNNLSIVTKSGTFRCPKCFAVHKKVYGSYKPFNKKVKK